MQKLQKHPSIILSPHQREIVTQAVIEVCSVRGYDLSALNVRTNHGHAVVSAQRKPDRIAGEFKAYATRALRAAHEFSASQKIWARGASTRYLWNSRHVEAAIDYVKYCQEDIPFEFKEKA